MQRPNITYPQLLELSPYLRKQWSKLSSTRASKKKLPKSIGLVRSNVKSDVVPIVDAWVKGQRITNVYVDEGAQMCVMTKNLMYKLRLEVDTPSQSKVKLANNSSIKCVGIIHNLKIKVFDIEVAIDMYVIPTKGEGYHIILGRPWLISMNVDQKWGAGVMVLKPEGMRGKQNQRITYDMRKGKEVDVRYETTVDEESSTYSTLESEKGSSYEKESSSLDVMGLTFGSIETRDNRTLERESEESKLYEKLKEMLAKDLIEEEKRDYLTMLSKYPKLFITDYTQIVGVDSIEHRIELKSATKPVAQKLRRLGVVQRNALLAEVNRLLKASFIYAVENLDWVSPVVVTPKKNGK